MLPMPDGEITRKALEELRAQPDKLIGIILRQADIIRQQTAGIARLEGRVRELEEQPGAGGGNTPGAAPFRVADKKRKAKPGRPGRKKGHKGSYRKPPEKADKTVEVPLEHCPDCGGELSSKRFSEQHIIELPRFQPLVIRLRTGRGHCHRCGGIRRATHPLQVSQATGAAGTHPGPGSLAAAAQLRYDAGLTLRGTCRVMQALLGLKLTPGGLSQGMDRVAGRLAPAHDALLAELLASRCIHTDETGWWLENRRASLWVMCNGNATYYRVVRHKDRGTLHTVIPPDWPHVLVSDCLSVYDGATPLQHKCHSHHLKAVSAAIRQRGSPGDWLNRIKLLLQTAMALDAVRAEFGPEDFGRKLAALKGTAHCLLTGEPRSCPQEESIRNRLWKQRDHLFVFLDHEGVDATSNLAERQLRPAVIRRKLSCGNKSQCGARSFEVMASLAATCRQKDSDFLRLVTAAAPLQQSS